MTILIDGYNLMYAVGIAPAEQDRAAFDAARRRFLDWLSGQPAIKGHAVRVVFDAQHSTRDHGSTAHRGLVVTFTHGETADDLIETMIATDKNPQRLRVVSNDHRILTAAKRGRCHALNCEAFQDLLDAGLPDPDAKPTADPIPTPEKPTPTPEELSELLKAFEMPLPKYQRKPR